MLQDELKCGVCLEMLKDPKYVGACHHSFCQQCLHGVIRRRKRTRGPVFTCPTCRRLCDIPAGGAKGLSNDFRITNVLQALAPHLEEAQRPDAPKIVCQICKLNKAVAYCKECGLGIRICKNCLSKHSKSKATEKHTVAPLEMLCEAHLQPMKLQCVTCSQRICHVCLLSDHADCVAMERETYLASLNETFQKNLKDGIELRDRLHSSSDVIRTFDSDFVRFTRQKAAEAMMKTSKLKAKRAAIDRQIKELKREKKRIKTEVKNTKCEDWTWAKNKLEELEVNLAKVTTDIEGMKAKEREVKSKDISTSEGECLMVQTNNDLDEVLGKAKRVLETASDMENTLSNIMGSFLTGTKKCRFIPPGLDHEIASRDGDIQYVSFRYQCIVAMNQYKRKSLEELRLEDYQEHE